jgi:hypothetical protein
VEEHQAGAVAGIHERACKWLKIDKLMKMTLGDFVAKLTPDQGRASDYGERREQDEEFRQERNWEEEF